MSDEKITDEQLRRLLGAAKQVREQARGFLEDLGAKSLGELREELGADFTWAQYYELSARDVFLLFLASVGALGLIATAAGEHLEPLQGAIEALEGFDPETSTEGGWNGGDGGLFEMRDVKALAIVQGMQMECLETFGKYVTELVDDVRKGVEESFFRAIRIDRAVLGTETFVAYLGFQHLKGNAAFFKSLGNALKGGWKKTMVHHRDLRVALQASLEGGRLGSLSNLSESARVFIRELKVYSDRGEDPERGLQRFIARWKANKLNK